MDFCSFVKRKRMLFYLLLFILVWLISFIVTYVYMPLGCDDVWLYGFSYNISKGLVIYRDFNVVTTPLYYFIGCFFLKIFGNYIISLGVFHSILVALMVLMMFRVIKWKAFIVFPLILVFFPNGYNLFALFWLMVILFLMAINKDNEILMAFVLGLLFITKQNIGLSLLIPYLYYCKHKIRGFLIFLIPFVIISIYLLLNNAFFEFIDYCFLGLFDFGTGNHYFDVFGIMEIFVLFYLIFKLFKSKFHDKEVFYITMFQIMIYPLSDGYHFFVSFFPVMYYIVKNNCSIQFQIVIAFFVYLFNICLFFSIDHEVYTQKDILYLKNSGDLPTLMKEFKEYFGDEENYYFTGYFGYLYKLYYDIPITHYDLWNEGNMGYKGVEKRILEVDEICAYQKCLFIVDDDIENNKKSQVNKFFRYIKENYKLIDAYNRFFIYSNSEIEKK